MIETSVVIRTKDEAAGLGTLLCALGEQSRPAGETIVVDSGSRDSTLAIARGWGARILELDPEQFSFGRALNLGSAAASGEFLVYLSAHACPVDEQYLERLLAPFVEPQVAGVYGRQIPWPKCNVFEASAIEAAFPAGARQQADDFFFSAANCAVRRARWEDRPFNEDLPGCEDQAWAKWAIGAGYRIIYEPTAEVFHSHNEGLRGVYRRSRREAIGDQSNGRLPRLDEAAKQQLRREFRRRCREHIGIALARRAPCLAPWGVLRCLAYSLGKYRGMRQASVTATGGRGKQCESLR